MRTSLKRFSVSWIVTSLVMFLLSFIWHGVILNDFSRLSYPKEVFLIFSAFAYIVIGFIVVKIFEVKVYEKYFFHKPILEGVIKGAFCGLIFFLIATVVGISFSTGTGIKNLMVDLVWQLIEQGIGGGVVGMLYMFTESKAF